MVSCHQNERRGRTNENVSINTATCDTDGYRSKVQGQQRFRGMVHRPALAEAGRGRRHTPTCTKKGFGSQGQAVALDGAAAVASRCGPATLAKGHSQKERAQSEHSPSRSIGSAIGCDGDLSTSSQTRMGGAPKMMPSSAELQRMYMEEKRREISDMRRKNEKTMHDAIHFPDVKPGASHSKRPLTVPQEFNLSAPSTPNRSRCNSVGSASDCEDGVRGSVARRRSSSVRRTPRLTVSQGPELRTALRPRSTSRQRASSRDVPSSPATWHRTLRGNRGADDREQATSASGATPSRARGPWVSSSRSQSRQASLSPARSAFGSNALLVTPQRQRSERRDPGSVRSIGSDMELCSSVDSRTSRDSRISRLSQRSCSRQQLSSEEIELIRAEAKRQEVKNQMRQNERTIREAFICPSSVPGVHRSLSLTVPKEFNLSVSNTPARSFASDCNSECEEDGEWSRSLRRPSAPPSPARSWQPQLTVPEAPHLRTACRSRSTSRSRSETPSRRSMSRHRLPREQAAIEFHLDRLAAARSGDVLSTPRRRGSHQAEFQQSRPDDMEVNDFSATRQRLDYSDSVPTADAGEAEPEPLATAEVTVEGTAQEDEADVSAAPVVQSLTTDIADEESATATVQDNLEPPAGADLDQWVRESANHQERAQRARRVAQLKVDKRQADDKASHCIFKSAPGSSASSSRRGRLPASSGSHASNSRQGNPKRSGAADQNLTRS